MNRRLAQKAECKTWNQRFKGSIIIGGNIFWHWTFLFLHSKASDTNIGIAANVVCL